jgi:hypothetical protein
MIKVVLPDSSVQYLVSFGGLGFGVSGVDIIDHVVKDYLTETNYSDTRDCNSDQLQCILVLSVSDPPRFVLHEMKLSVPVNQSINVCG